MTTLCTESLLLAKARAFFGVLAVSHLLETDSLFRNLLHPAKSTNPTDGDGIQRSLNLL